MSAVSRQTTVRVGDAVVWAAPTGPVIARVEHVHDSEHVTVVLSRRAGFLPRGTRRLLHTDDVYPRSALRRDAAGEPYIAAGGRTVAID